MTDTEEQGLEPDFWQWYDLACQEALCHDVPITELEWLIDRCTDLDKLKLRLRSDTVTRSQQQQLQQLWQRRWRDRMPVQYLVGEVTWRDLELAVTPAVLIPRPETELIVDIVSAWMARADNIDKVGIPDLPSRWVDLGTGSGAIAIGLATTLSNLEKIGHLEILATDCSPEAIAVAQANAIRHGCRDRIRFLQGHWFEPLGQWRGEITGIVSNPPYIPSAEVPLLQPEVVRHEPRLALDGGDDGLVAIRHAIVFAPDYLISGGFWLVEVMDGQAETVRDLLQENGNYQTIQIHGDRAGVQRFVSAVRV